MTEEEKESIEEFRKQLRLAINIDDVTTAIRNDNAQTILNLIEKLQKENENFEKLNKDYSYSVDIVRENTRLRRQVFDLELENEKLKKTATNRSE